MLRLVAVLLLLCPFVAAEESFIPADLALAIVKKSVPEAEWQRRISSAESMFETWQRDNPDGNRKRFLDDKLLQIAHAVPTKVDTLKAYVMWLALYAQYAEATPAYLNGGAKYKQEIRDLIDHDFTWEKALVAVNRHAGELEEARRR